MAKREAKDWEKKFMAERRANEQLLNKIEKFEQQVESFKVR